MLAAPRVDLDELARWSAELAREDFAGVAERQFGAVVLRRDHEAACAPASARFAEVTFEYVRAAPDRIVGVRLRLASPEPVAWQEVCARFGESVGKYHVMDGWTDPHLHGFRVGPGGSPSRILLAGEPSDEPTSLTRIILRWFPPALLAPPRGA